MTWLVGLGIGVLVGAVIIGLTMFHGRARTGGAQMPLDPADARRLGYLPVGPRAARRIQGQRPIIFEWTDGPVWRVAAAGDPEPLLLSDDVALLRGQLDEPIIASTGRAIELRGGDGADPVHHLRAAELLVVIARRLASESPEDIA